VELSYDRAISDIDLIFISMNQGKPKILQSEQPSCGYGWEPSVCGVCSWATAKYVL